MCLTWAPMRGATAAGTGALWQLARGKTEIWAPVAIESYTQLSSRPRVGARKRWPSTSHPRNIHVLMRLPCAPRALRGLVSPIRRPSFEIQRPAFLRTRINNSLCYVFPPFYPHGGRRRD